MVDDMANGDASRVYQDAATAQLSERVTNMGRRVNDVEVEMRSGFNQLGASLNTATNETRASIATLSNTMADRNRPQYQALGFALTVILAVGALAYWPIREQTNDVKAAVLSLSQETNRSFETVGAKMVTREELDWRASRATEDRERINAAITDVRSIMLPRNEWMERNQSRDHDVQNIRDAQAASVMAVQRQIDQIRGDLSSLSGSLGNGRDTFADLKIEQGRLRDQLIDLMSRLSVGSSSPHM